MKFRDGYEVRPFKACGMWCGGIGCQPMCHQADIDAALRGEGWIPIEDAPVEAGLEIEGLTADGRRILAHYYAKGDYLDRWTDRGCNVLLTLTHWRPVRLSIR